MALAMNDLAVSLDGGDMPTADLWRRLQAFELDAPACGLTFTERAARENGWTLGFTNRVKSEYKRFLLLAMTCEHVVCPSEAVDQLWHMHLTYTRSYWEELCGNVLGKALHHGPTRGGSDEQQKYFHLYQQTLQAYTATFGTPPPADIWPAAEQRFGEDLACVRVNLQRAWVIPKPRWSRRTVGLASASLLIPLAQLAANPLDWTGPQFLMLYAGLLAIAIAASWLGRLWLLSSADSYQFQPGAPDAIGPIEVGWLQAGDQRAIDCALVELVQKNAVTVEGERIMAGPNVATAHAEHRISELILSSVASSSLGRKYDIIRREANVGLVGLRQDLQEKGLVLDYSQRISSTFLPIALLGGVLLLGLAKAWIGTTRGKPIELLLIAMALTLVALVAFVVTTPRLTLAGKRLLTKLLAQSRRNPQELLGIQTSPSQPNDDGLLLWSTAFMGTAVLASTPLFGLDSFLRQQQAVQSSSTGGCSTTGCGTSGCSGGGGGCGGGGCGGCGGS